MATAASTSMSAAAVFLPRRLPTYAVTPCCSALPCLPPPRFSSTQAFLTSLKQMSCQWDALENKSTVILYGGGAIVAVWLSSIVVGAINSVPLIMELVGLGYTGWGLDFALRRCVEVRYRSWKKLAEQRPRVKG